jgi:hypothetical protein
VFGNERKEALTGLCFAGRIPDCTRFSGSRNDLPGSYARQASGGCTVPPTCLRSRSKVVRLHIHYNRSVFQEQLAVDRITTVRGDTQRSVVELGIANPVAEALLFGPRGRVVWDTKRTQ